MSASSRHPCCDCGRRAVVDNDGRCPACADDERERNAAAWAQYVADAPWREEQRALGELAELTDRGAWIDALDADGGPLPTENAWEPMAQ